MDQVKIGRFIAEMRKEKGMTQRALADKLCVSDKTVSKWECGGGLPEVSLMLPLCDALDISVNELLSGMRLGVSEYKMKAEENIMSLIKEKEENKKKIILATVIGFITILSSLSLIVTSGLAEIPTAARIVLVAVGLVVLILGIGVCCVLECGAGAYECRHCGELFVPSMKAYIMAPHTITTRRLRCPACGKKSYCRKRLSTDKNE